MARTLVGVDIGSYSVKCVVLERDKSKYQTRYKNEYLLSDYDNVFGYPSSALDAILIDFVSRHRIQSPVFCFTLSCISPYVFTQVYQVPKVSSTELSQGIRYEMQERSLIEDVDDYHYQWEILNTLDDVYQVLSVAIRKDVVAMLRKIKRPGWAVHTIEPQAVSLGRVVGGNVAVLDFGHTGTRLFIYKDGCPCHVQKVDIGGITFTDIISKEYSDEQQVIHLKHFDCAVLLGHQEMESSATTLHLSSLIESSVRHLSIEIKRSLRSVETAEGFSIEAIYYIGGGARLRYLPEYLSRELGLELTPISLSDRGMDVFGDYSYTLAGGAWLSKDYAYMKSINFNRLTGRAFRPSLRNYSKLLYGLLAAGLLLNVGMYDLVRRVRVRHDMLSVWEQELQCEMDSLSSEIDKYDIQVTHGLLERLSRISESERTFSSKILRKLPSLVPDAVMLHRVSLDSRKKKVDIYGLSRDYSGIGFFAIALERQFAQENVKIESYDVLDGAYCFKIVLKVP